MSGGEAPRLFLVRLAGDFYTKARATRLRFLRRLERNLSDALTREGIAFTLRERWSRLEVEVANSSDEEIARASDVMSRVFGVQSLSEVQEIPWTDISALEREVVAKSRERVRGKSFAVRARRLGDRTRGPLATLSSHEIEKSLGAALVSDAAGVNLKSPEVLIRVEIEPERCFLSAGKVAGPGGLPVGTQGRAIALVSGGFDSAVAAWTMLRRGVEVHFAFGNLGLEGGASEREAALQTIRALVARWGHGYRAKFHEVDLAPFVAAMQRAAHPYHFQVLLKRALLRMGERIAKESSAVALITGDAVGQVSSQTLENLAMEDAVRLLVLRPLVGQGKEEILSTARAIGIFEPAAQVAERCDLAGRRPATRARFDPLHQDEAKLDPALLDVALRERRIWDLSLPSPSESSLPRPSERTRGTWAGERREGASRAGSAAPPSLPDPSLSLGMTEIHPLEVILLDLRSRAEFDAWHHPTALHLEFEQAVAAYASFRRDREYLLVCEIGYKSVHLARLLNDAGFAARPYPGGLAALRAEDPAQD